MTLNTQKTSPGMRRPLFVVLFLLTISVVVTAQRRERLIDTWRPTHYDVSITFNDQLSEIASARTEVSAVVMKDNVSVIDLDFGAMPIDSVMIDGQAARFERKPDLLNVLLPHVANNGDQFSVTVTY